jgi:2,3-dihydroxybenzoate decarboxylase
MRKIALEEHFLCPGFEEYWLPTVADVPAEPRARLVALLTDFGEQRLAAMDEAGIERSILSLSGPGVQVERDRTRAVRMAAQANDFLAAEVAKRPDRYSGFAHLALQDGKAAADELERCVRDLGFKGALVNGHTNGLYLDDPSLEPLWERAQELGTVIYLHPGDPVSQMPVLDGHKGLKRATWEWTVETGSHALRVVFGGVFDRYPQATLALGHLGETLPYLLWRFDSRAKLYGLKLGRAPSAYIRENIVVTLSGMFSREPLICALDALGDGRVMFSADYPYESAGEAGRFIDDVDLPEERRAKVCHANAERIFDLAGRSR